MKNKRFENIVSTIKSNFLSGIIVVSVYWIVMYLVTTIFLDYDSLSWKIYYYGYVPLAQTSHDIFEFIHPVVGIKIVYVRFCLIACGVSEGDGISLRYSGYFEVFFISSVIFLLVASVQKLVRIWK